MLKPFYDDLLLVLIMTLLSTSFLLSTGLDLFSLTSPFIYIPYILLLVFLPGYSLLAMVNPEFVQNTILKRVGLSIVVSLVISIFLAFLLTYTPLKIFNNIIVYIIGAFTIILSLIAIIKRRKYNYVHFVEPGLARRRLDRKPKLKKKETLETPQLKIEKIGNLKQGFKTGNQESIPEEPDKLERDEQPDILEPDEHLNKTNPETEVKPPRRFDYLDLMVVLFLTILSLVFVLVPSLNSFSVMGLFLMFFLPGYALIAAVYPRQDDLKGVVRLVLSFSISYFLTSVTGLILNYTPLGNNINYILLILSALTLILIGAAFLVRRHIQEEDRFLIPVKISDFPHITSASFSVGGSRNRNILLVIVIIITALLVATPTYELMKPTEKVKYTEFYVLGPDGNNISTYPQNLTTGEIGTVTMVLVNHENTNTTYRIVTTSNQTVMDEINVTLKPNEKKEIPYNFTAGESGNKKIEFLLYKLPNITDVYLSHSFWLNILEQVTESDETETSTDTQTIETPEYTDEPQYTEPEYTDETDY